jgi:F420-0:gamma-glutamyl ligase
MQVRPVKTRVFKESEDLVAFVRAHVKRVPERSVLVITSKIVALAEGRTADASQKQRLIEAESDFVLKTKHVVLTLKDSLLIANAGIDESNGNGRLILLPKDSYQAAAKLRHALMKAYRIKELGVLITDSRVLPLRQGVIGVALGYAGFKGLHDYRKERDLFGRPFRFSQTNIADGLAASAVVAMGEGAESMPLALIEDARIEFTGRMRPNELSIPLADDLYLPFFGKIPRRLLTRRPQKRHR